MAETTWDGVIETVHYAPDAQIDWVRAYERRGATYSDVVLLKRAELIRKIQSGRKFASGRRVLNLASTFTALEPVHLEGNGESAHVVCGSDQNEHDDLGKTPVV
ncbi:MAG: hypothetical protein ABSA51_10115 [Anaerolineaceae bacterium]|jgi:hypothetical protein